MKMTTRGRVTIPKSLRDEMGLKGGSEVDFEYIGEGRRLFGKQRRRAAG